jgi:hypothetical protein
MKMTRTNPTMLNIGVIIAILYSKKIFLLGYTEWIVRILRVLSIHAPAKSGPFKEAQSPIVYQGEQSETKHYIYANLSSWLLFHIFNAISWSVRHSFPTDFSIYPQIHIQKGNFFNVLRKFKFLCWCSWVPFPGPFTREIVLFPIPSTSRKICKFRKWRKFVFFPMFCVNSNLTSKSCLVVNKPYVVLLFSNTHANLWMEP